MTRQRAAKRFVRALQASCVWSAPLCSSARVATPNRQKLIPQAQGISVQRDEVAQSRHSQFYSRSGNVVSLVSLVSLGSSNSLALKLSSSSGGTSNRASHCAAA